MRLRLARKSGSVLPMAALYLGLTTVFAWACLWPSESFYRWDSFLYIWPVFGDARAQLQAGELPFWSDAYAGGTPLYANINAGLLNPLRIPQWILPLELGYGLFLFLGTWLSLLFMHALLEGRLGMRRAPAMVGAMVYAFSGYVRGMWDTHNLAVFPYIPLAFFALLAGTDRSHRGRAILGLTLAWSLLFLSGDTQAAVLWTGAAGLLVLVHPSRRELLPVLGGALVLGTLLTAPQWLPAMEAMSASSRAGGLDFIEATNRSFHPLRLFELVTPHVFGNHAVWFAGDLAGEGATIRSPWTGSFHVGIAGLLLATLGVLRRRRRWQGIWAVGLFGLATLLALGKFLPGFELWLRIPVIGGFRYPEKYLLWSSFALAVLAARGCGPFLALLRNPRLVPRARRLLFGWVLVCGVVTIAAVQTARGVFSPLDPWIDDAARDAWLLGRGLELLLTATPLLVLCLRGPRRHAALFVPALVVWSLLVPWYRESPTTSRYDPWTPPPLAQEILSSEDPNGRFFRDPAAVTIPVPEFIESLENRNEQEAVHRIAELSFNTPAAFGLRAASGFSPLESRAMSKLREAARQPGDDGQALARFCRLLGVRWLLTIPPRAKQLANQGLQVRAVQRWQDGENLTVLTHLENTPETWLVSPDGRTLRGSGQLVLSRSSAGSFEVEHPAAPPGVRLVVASTWDAGWRAMDGEGASLPLTKFDDVLLAVELPEEAGVIRFRYEPPMLRVGLGLALLGLVGLGAIVFAGRGRGRAGGG